MSLQILYLGVARNTTILAGYTKAKGNVQYFARNILDKIRDKIGEYDRGNFVRSINEYKKLISKKLKIKKVQVEYPILPPLNFVKFICN